jgi:hypothetical protein
MALIVAVHFMLTAALVVVVALLSGLETVAGIQGQGPGY